MSWQKTKIQNLLKHSDSGIYYARFRVGGKLRWKSLKTKVYSVAKLRIVDALKRERRLQDSIASKDTGRMLAGDAIALYRLAVEQSDLKASSMTARLYAIGKIEKTWPALGTMDVRRVTREQCREWAANFRSNGTGFTPPGAREREKAGASPSSFNKAVDTLRRIFGVAVEAGAIYENPARGIKRATEGRKQLRLPTRAQFRTFVEAIEHSGAAQAHDCADLVRYLAFSGARIGEARVLTWRAIDFDRNQLLIAGEKSESSYRVIPMIQPLRDLLERMRSERPGELASALVHQVRECQKSMDRAAQIADIDRLTHHGLRHFFCTICIESGVDIPTLSRWCGHKDGGALLMKRYGHLRDEHSANSALKVSFEEMKEPAQVISFKAKGM